MLSAIAADLLFATRLFRRSPAFTAISILCIALGSGAVTTIYSAVNSIVLRPLPGVTDGTRLVGLERRQADYREGVSGSYHYYDTLREAATTLADLAGWSKVDLSIGVDGAGYGVYGNIVTGNYFDVLGVRPALGRFFLPGEARAPGESPLVIVSYSFWRSHLAADAGAIGRTLTVNGHPYTLIGVTPPAFRGVFTPLKPDAWVPLTMQAELRPGRDLTDAPWMWLFGRMKPGITQVQVRDELSTLTAAYAREAAEPSGFRVYDHVRVSSLTGLPGDAQPTFLGFAALLFGAASLVLLIASLNVASMLSARGIARRGELAVRAALGASRARIVRQLLTEVLLLFLAGGLGGLALAIVGTRGLEALPIPGTAPVVLELSPDLRVLAFALAVSIVTGLAFGLPPALQASRIDVSERLRALSPGSGRRGTWFGRTLIVGQLAFSLVLMVAAGLFARALGSGQRVDPGFDMTGVLVAPVNTESWGYDTVRGQQFFRDVRARIAAIPGVASVSSVSIVPLSASGSGGTVTLPGAGPERDRRRSVQVTAVDPDYFAVVRLPLLRGRPIAARDDEHSARVAVVNETFARRFSGGLDVIGTTFAYGGGPVTVVGVARDAKYNMLDEATPAFVYLAMAQAWRPDQTLLVRAGSRNGAEGLGPALQAAVLSIDPSLPRPRVTTLAQEASIVLLPQRVAAIVTGAFGVVGLLLASVGLYGLIAYSVNRRRREIGVRMALGAGRGDVLRMIVRDGMRLASMGLAAGLLLAAAATRLIAGFLFSVSPLDAVTFGTTGLVLLVVALAASYLPARRAASADPLEALRTD